MTNNTLYVFCGIPGSGKTTASQKLILNIDAKLYCFDDIPGSRDPTKALILKDEMYSKIRSDLIVGHNIILDDLHTKKIWRQKLLEVVEHIPCKKILIVLSTPLDECLCRNKQRQNSLPDLVVKVLSKKYEEPTLDEGWDEIIWR